MKETKKKKYGKILWIMMTLLLLAVGVCMAGVIDYLNRVPKISAKESLEVISGETLSVSDLAKITCKGKYTVRLAIAETNVKSAKVLDDEPKLEGDGSAQKRDDPALYVGDESGYIRLLIVPQGTVAERVSAYVTIYVKPSEAEQKQILKDAEERFVKIREYLEERGFSDQKLGLDEELVTLYYLNPIEQIGYAKYYLKRKVGKQEVCYEILANYELVSKDAGPQLKDALAREIDEEAFHQAQELPEKVILTKEKEP